VASDDDALEAFTTMQEENVGRLVVMDGEEFVGLVTRSDLMTALDIIRTSGSLDPRQGTVPGRERLASEAPESESSRGR
jgi:predicted transcriptional regulator